MTSTQVAPARNAPVVAGMHRFMARHASWIPVFTAVAILIAMAIGAQVHFGHFLTPRLTSSLLLDNAYLLILAVGMTFVILTGGIDLSVGAVMSFTGMMGASTFFMMRSKPRWKIISKSTRKWPKREKRSLRNQPSI